MRVKCQEKVCGQLHVRHETKNKIPLLSPKKARQDNYWTLSIGFLSVVLNMSSTN